MAIEWQLVTLDIGMSTPNYALLLPVSYHWGEHSPQEPCPGLHHLHVHHLTCPATPATKTEAGVVQELMCAFWISVMPKQQQHCKEVREKVKM